MTKKIWDYIKKNKLQDEKKKTLGGIQLIKIWLESSHKEQGVAPRRASTHPLRQWKLVVRWTCPRVTKWFEHRRAREMMFKATDSKHALCAYFAFRRQEARAAQSPPSTHPRPHPPQKGPRQKVKLPKRSMKGAYDDEATVAHRKFIPEKY